ncbi:restriction endonuclease subunit S [Paracidovorax citrulli]|uniref:Restriction modification system DNA specificity domain protein n=2 Tax=Paracidovorax citrulli TaxID=80869 RepID=A1TSH8_PARC0|nr:restriction modification system DNA specificity domain protein [Paracidovorax citrulli AAC00-1]PVY63352.1 type I restriction enzyme S subunit [Paracidovorax citrulli]REG67680.1 type I restriction enzyme S subunit [Paracidovorax citrulli]RLJ92240.1 type I restriction enzyme S subunit [Paracidovorax citrulli]
MNTSTVRVDPEVWRLARLKFVAPLRNERMSAGSDHPGYLGLENIESWTGRIIEVESKRDDEPADQSAGLANIFREGDVLFCKLRPYLAKACHAPRDGVGSTELLVMRPSELLEPRFLLYSILTPDFVGAVDASTFGAKMPRANWDFIGSLEVKVPPLEEQRLIANYLDRETAGIDGLIAEKERMLALLEEKRAALISRVVTRGLDPNAPLKPSGQEWLGEIPVHWGLQRLKQLAEVRGGLTLGKQYSGELLEYPYLRVANVQDGYLKLDDVLTVEVPASEAASNLLVYGDVLMNEGGDIDKLGRGCVWRDEISPCLHQNHVFAVRPHSVDSDWLALWTSTIQAKRYFESRAKRSTNLASISGSNIKELPVPLPPVSEQLAIQNFLAVRHSRLETLRGELRDSLRLLIERRAALITAGVTGQIPLEELAG